MTVVADRRPTRADRAIAAAVAVVQVGITTIASTHQDDRQTVDVLAVALLLIAPAALVWRRAHPVPVLVVAHGATLAYWLTDYGRGPIFFALIIALLTAMTEGHRVAAWATLAVGYVAFGWLPFAVGDEGAPGWGGALGLAAWLLVLGTTGEILRIRKDRLADAARTRAEEARRRASDERLRIARELHDVVAHNLSLINVQAGVALHLMEERPEQAASALAAIKDASKTALDELRSVLTILRHDGEEAPRAPAPGLDDLEGLIERAASSQLAVRLEVDGERRLLPAAVERAAYRIVQEALTNVARHAGPATAVVRLEYGDHDLAVEVVDDGAGVRVPEAMPGSGTGITGMRERVTALGGRLDAGPRPDRGFRVRAWIPFEETDAP